MMRQSILAIGVFLLLAGLAVTGCGGGSDNDSTAQTGGNEVTKKADTGRAAGSEEGGSSNGGKKEQQEEQLAEKQEEELLAERKEEELAEKQEEQRAIESGAKRKQGFLAEAEKLCREQRKSMQEKTNVFLGKAKPGRSVEVARHGIVEEVIAPGLEAEAEGLGELEAPQGDEEEVDALIAAIEESAAEARKDPGTYFAEGKIEKADDLARAYGLIACGNFSS